MWYDLPRFEFKVPANEKDCRENLGNTPRVGEEKMMCTQDGMTKQPRYLLWHMCWPYSMGHTLRSSCLLMLGDVNVDSREPNGGRAWTFIRLNHSSVEHLPSGNALNNSALINSVHDKILDAWFLFSQCTTRPRKHHFFQTPFCTSLLSAHFPKKTFHHLQWCKILE